MAIDIVLIVILPCIDGILINEYINAENAQNEDARVLFGFIIDMYKPILSAIFSLILAISACFIANWVTKYTKSK